MIYAEIELEPEKVSTFMRDQKILIIDDDTGLTELVKEYLAQSNIPVIEAHTPDAGLELFNKHNPALILLDVMLPDRNGFELCKELRRVSDVPIIMLTAKGTVIDRILGLELGADDYLPKPFEPRELLARIQAILRRGRKADSSRILKFNDLTINLSVRTVTKLDEPVPLTTAEFELLSLFVNKPKTTITRDEISHHMRGVEWEVVSRSVDVIMSRLRQKIGDDPKAPRYFRTVWGTGYMFIGEPLNS